MCRFSLISLVITFVSASCLSPQLLHAEEEYTPGPVVVLHEWLGEQCSFVPDLDVADCCAVHDNDYLIGGNEFDRWWADLRFRQCIRERGRPVVAEIYYAGVRLFGWMFFNYD